MDEKERNEIEQQARYNKLYSPATINVHTTRLKFVNLQFRKKQFLMGWGEFIFDYVSELLEAIYGGVFEGKTLDDGTALTKVLDKWENIRMSRIKKRGYLTPEDKEKLNIPE